MILDDRTIDLVEEGIDDSLRMGSLPDSSLTAPRLARAPRLVVATPAYLARAGEPAVPADLAAHEAVVYTQGPSTIWSFEHAGTLTSVAVRGRLRVSSAEGLRAAVLADMGLAIASRWMFAPELAAGAVRRVLGAWALPPVDLWAVFPSALNIQERV